MTKRRTGLWWAVAVVVLLLLVVPAFEVAWTDLWVCEVTGSVKHCDTTWFSSTGKERFEPSPLEAYLRNASLGEVKHRWVRLSRTGYNLLGGGMSHADSSKPTYCLKTWIDNPDFADLPDDHKKMIYNVLVQTKTWTDEEKRQLYDNLSRLQGKKLRIFIRASWEKLERE